MSITIALPSKGRMKDDALAVFKKAGMDVVSVANDRSYCGCVDGMAGGEIAYLSASEIARELGNGGVDLGITGEYLSDADNRVTFRARHGRRLRIATKYWRLTQRFFSAQHGIQVYRIVESLGATEGAPASGQADIIVDITSTGSTLRANHLKVFANGIILQSERAWCSRRSGRGMLPIGQL